MVLVFFLLKISLEKVEPVRQTNLGPAKSECSCAGGKVELRWGPGNILALKPGLRILVVQGLACVIE